MNWLRRLFAAPCRHERTRGVANYYDHDRHIFVHLVECEDCHQAMITGDAT